MHGKSKKQSYSGPLNDGSSNKDGSKVVGFDGESTEIGEAYS